MTMTVTSRLALDEPQSTENISAYPAEATQALGILDNAVLYTQGTYASRPSAGSTPVGNEYYCTDTAQTFKQINGAWQQVFAGSAYKIRRANASSGNDYSFGGAIGDIDATNLNVTMQCSGAPVRVSLDCLCATGASSGGDTVPVNLRMDTTYAWGTSPTPNLPFWVPNQTVGGLLHLEYVFSPSAGSHTFAPQAGSNGVNTVYVFASNIRPVIFQVRELN